MPPIVNSAVEWREADIVAPRGDGHWFYCYPGTRCLLAQGQLAGGRHVGWWRFWYSSGALLACGEFDAQGRRQGLWGLWTARGDLSVERSGIRCEHEALYSFFAGTQGFEWDRFREPSRTAVSGLLQFSSLAWNGAGAYTDGFWQGPLPEATAP